MLHNFDKFLLHQGPNPESRTPILVPFCISCSLYNTIEFGPRAPVCCDDSFVLGEIRTLFDIRRQRSIMFENIENKVKLFVDRLEEAMPGGCLMQSFLTAVFLDRAGRKTIKDCVGKEVQYLSPFILQRIFNMPRFPRGWFKLHF